MDTGIWTLKCQNAAPHSKSSLNPESALSNMRRRPHVLSAKLFLETARDMERGITSSDFANRRKLATFSKPLERKRFRYSLQGGCFTGRIRTSPQSGIFGRSARGGRVRTTWKSTRLF